MAEPSVALPSYDKVLPGPVQEAAPPRRPCSIRRTSNLDVTRGDGTTFGFGTVAVAGSSRDLLTGADGAPSVLRTARLALTIGPDGLIDGVDYEPSTTDCAALIGKHIGFGFRSSVKDLLTALEGTPLGLLVDDLSGAPAPSGYGSIREGVLLGRTSPVISATAAPTSAPTPAPTGATQRDVCAGWHGGGLPTLSRERGEPMPFDVDIPAAPDLWGTEPIGWHEMGELNSKQSRRIRRLDLWREGDRLLIDAMFRDSTVDPDLTQRVVHEYTVSAVLDAETGTVLEIEAVPRSLPFPTDCPFAAGDAAFLLGQPAAGLRKAVRSLSAGPASCTHLNDAFRSLADAPTLAGLLPT